MFIGTTIDWILTSPNCLGDNLYSMAITSLMHNISKARPTIFLAEATLMTSLKPPVVSVVLLVVSNYIVIFSPH